MTYTQENTFEQIYKTDKIQDIHQEHLISEYQFEGFEGPEKKIELEFRYSHNAIQHNKRGLRQLEASEWQSQLLDDVHCKIISQTSNHYFDSYVLSESSLFVYPFKLILKTCGTTTLLHAVEPILKIASQLELVIDFCWFSRKNYVFPHMQLAPHTSWEDEITHLDQYFPNGNGFIVGPMSKDHWYLFLADYRNKMDQEESILLNTPVVVHGCNQPDQTFEVLMHELSPETMKQFFKDESFVSSEQTTISSGIADLLPGIVIDAFQFEPCGYSMNGLLGESYCTIHITPEDSCSFASFETNYLPSKGANYYSELTRKVLNVFKPGRFSITLLADDHVPIGTGEDSRLSHQNSLSAFSNLKLPEFTQLSKSFYEFEGGFNMTFCSYQKKPEEVMKKERRLSDLVINTTKKHKANEICSLSIVASQDDFDDQVSDSSNSDSEAEREDTFSSVVSSPSSAMTCGRISTQDFET